MSSYKLFFAQSFKRDSEEKVLRFPLWVLNLNPERAKVSWLALENLTRPEILRPERKIPETRNSGRDDRTLSFLSLRLLFS